MESGQPTVVVRLGSSWITRDQRGEIIETNDVDVSGRPDWSQGGICDHRGGGGAEGFRLLAEAMDGLEENARMVGLEVERIGDPPRGSGGPTVNDPMVFERLVLEVAGAILDANEAWQRGEMTSPSELDFVLDADRILSRTFGDEYHGSTEEGRAFVADVIFEDAGEKWSDAASVAREILTQLLAE